MTTIEDAKNHWQEVQDKFKLNTPTRFAWTGDGHGAAASNFYHNYMPGYIWAREEDGRPFPVLNRGAVTAAVNVPIVLGYDEVSPDHEQVLDVNWDALPSDAGGGSTILSIGPHHLQHEWRGGDTVFVDSRQFNPGLIAPTNPPSMQVTIKGFVYLTDRWRRFSASPTGDLTSEIPSSGSGVVVLIAFNLDSREIDYLVGDEFVVADQDTWDMFDRPEDVYAATPEPLSSHKPLGAVFLSSSTTDFNWNETTDNIYDMRLHTDRSERADAVGQINISLDGETFKRRIPVTDKQVGLLFDSQSGYIIVA